MLPALASLSACGTVGYYAQAIEGHLGLMHAARPVSEVVSDPATPPALRDKLRRIQVMREFAVRELGEPDNGSYRRYADLHRPFVVWNVIATPEFSVTPIQSCFPIAGCVSYRGWYSEAKANQDAQRLAAEGDDVFVGGVPAYSTLGWFDDPLLNTFMRYPDAEVARLIFHELAHQMLYVNGDSSFNESWAVSVEEEGVRRWLRTHATAEERKRYAAFNARREQFTALIGVYRDKLKAYYESADKLVAPERSVGKAKLFAALDSDYDSLKTSWGGIADYDRFMGRPSSDTPVTVRKPNNALLASVVTYSEWLPAFRELLAEQHGDLPSYYRAVKALSNMPRKERDEELMSLQQKVGHSPAQ